MTFWIFVVSLVFLLVAAGVVGPSGICVDSERFTAPIRIVHGTTQDGPHRAAAFGPKFVCGKVM